MARIHKALMPGSVVEHPETLKHRPEHSGKD